MFSGKFCLVGLLIACSFYGGVRATDCNGTISKESSLCQDFQTLINLAPRQSVLSLVRTHMSSDSRFRKAVQFMLSPQFKTATKMIDDSAIYHSFLSKFTAAGVDITDIESVSKIFECLIIPYINEANGLRTASRSVSSFEHKVQKRSLDTFVQEFNALIPKNELIKTIKDLLAESDNFTEFYYVVREPSFRSEVTQAMINREIARPIKILRRNQIDLSKLVEYGLGMLYLGPYI